MFIAHQFGASLFSHALLRKPVQSMSGLWLVLAAGQAGATLPDFPLICNVLYNLVQGREPQWQLWFFVKPLGEALHHVLVWAVIVAAAIWAEKKWPQLSACERFYALKVFVFTVIAIHIIPDAYTHGTGVGVVDINYFWPFSMGYSESIGLWDYRTGKQIVIKPEERAFNLVMVLGSVAITLIQRSRWLKVSEEPQALFAPSPATD